MKGKNYKGGYKIISLLGVSLADGESYTIAGIHKAIESSYRKPLLIEGIVVDGVEKDAIWVKELKVVEGSFVIELYGLKLTISDEDEVTVEEELNVLELEESINITESDVTVLVEDSVSRTIIDVSDLNLKKAPKQVFSASQASYYIVDAYNYDEDGIVTELQFITAYSLVDGETIDKLIF